MSFIELNGMNEAKEPELAPEGEYQLTLTNPEAYVNEKGRDIVKVRVEFTDYPEYQSFMHWIAMPSKKLDDEKVYNSLLLGVKRFLNLFGIPADNGFNVEDLQGATAVAKVIQETSDDGEHVNNRIIVPRIREE